MTQAKQANTPIRFVTAASLFDGHDASINIMRRVLQAQGAEVIHLGHDRSAHDVVEAAIQEDAHGIAVSSYQGGHVEYFTYMVELLASQGRQDIGIFGGGGGTITDKEIELLHARGVSKLYSVEDGRRLGLEGMISDMIERARRDLTGGTSKIENGHFEGDGPAVARTLTRLEQAHAIGDSTQIAEFLSAFDQVDKAPVLGITGVGGAGKSSLTDELVRRFLDAYPDRRFAVLSVDPTRRRSGGALLGDRIRMNSTSDSRVYMRSMATRQANVSVPTAVRDALHALRSSRFDLVILETAGIGQSGSEVVDLSDLSLYVMTPEFGAPSQLEKIDMLDFADMVAINKADKRGALDALRYVKKQVQRNRKAFDAAVDDMPVYPCMASRFGDDGLDSLFRALNERLDACTEAGWQPGPQPQRAPTLTTVVPPERARYLSEISAAIRNYKQETANQVKQASLADGLHRTLMALGHQMTVASRYDGTEPDDATQTLIDLYNSTLDTLSKQDRESIFTMADTRRRYGERITTYQVRGRDVHVESHSESLSGNWIPWLCPSQTTGVRFSSGVAWKIYRAHSHSQPASFHSSELVKIRPACSRVKVILNAPTIGFTICPEGNPRQGCRPHSTR